MNYLPALLMLASGALHAVVNAILKSGGDKMSGRALIDGSSALFVLPFALFTPFPWASAPWLAGSMAVHVVYLLCLVKAFEAADMSAVYPVMRGSAPAIAAAAAVLLLDDPISWAVVAGIALVTAGTLVVAWWNAPSPKALAWALATGAMTALYTVLDAQGSRAAGSATDYIVWFFLSLGGSVALLFAVWRGPVFLLTAREQWKPGITAGALSIATYGLALTAYRLGDVPRLAAMRESSILFGVAIAFFILKEKVGMARLLGACGIAAGTVVLLMLR